MIYEILYPIAMFLFIVTGFILGAISWFLWREYWYSLLDWAGDMWHGFNRWALDKLMDSIMGTKGKPDND